MNLTQTLENKQHARREWERAPFELKLAALIRMQSMAREMARAAGRPFHGTVWQPTGWNGQYPSGNGTAAARCSTPET